jgi:hypothetical protein
MPFDLVIRVVTHTEMTMRYLPFMLGLAGGALATAMTMLA